MTYIPTSDYKMELERLDSMVLSLTGAVVLLYAAIAEIASASDNTTLRQSLTEKAEEISHRLDDIIAAMTRKNETKS